MACSGQGGGGLGIEIRVARHAGFCFGVKRAVQMAFDAASQRDARRERAPIYTLGPLIHNPQVVRKLEKMGIHPVSTVDETQRGMLIIRSHGVPPQVLEDAVAQGMEIIDATCPFVKKAQRKVAELAEEGFIVLIVGDRHHPEVQALLGYGKGRTRFLEEVDPGETFPRVGIVCQTTQSRESLNQGVIEVLETMGSVLEELRVCNTICESTQVRQRECKALAELSDLVIVVGGKNSANTTRLAEISRSILGEAYHIEGAEELDPRWFRGKKRIGVTAGASTPDWIVGEVVGRIKLIGGSGEHGGEKRDYSRGTELFL